MIVTSTAPEQIIKTLQPLVAASAFDPGVVLAVFQKLAEFGEHSRVVSDTVFENLLFSLQEDSLDYWHADELARLCVFLVRFKIHNEKLISNVLRSLKHAICGPGLSGLASPPAPPLGVGLASVLEEVSLHAAARLFAAFVQLRREMPQFAPDPDLLQTLLFQCAAQVRAAGDGKHFRRKMRPVAGLQGVAAEARSDWYFAEKDIMPVDVTTLAQALFELDEPRVRYFSSIPTLPYATFFAVEAAEGPDRHWEEQEVREREGEGAEEGEEEEVVEVLEEGVGQRQEGTEATEAAPQQQEETDVAPRQQQQRRQEDLPPLGFRSGPFGKLLADAIVECAVKYRNEFTLQQLCTIASSVRWVLRDAWHEEKHAEQALVGELGRTRLEEMKQTSATRRAHQQYMELADIVCVQLVREVDELRKRREAGEATDSIEWDTRAKRIAEPIFAVFDIFPPLGITGDRIGRLARFALRYLARNLAEYRAEQVLSAVESMYSAAPRGLLPPDVLEDLLDCVHDVVKRIDRTHPRVINMLCALAVTIDVKLKLQGANLNERNRTRVTRWCQAEGAIPRDKLKLLTGAVHEVVKLYYPRALLRDLSVSDTARLLFAMLRCYHRLGHKPSSNELPVAFALRDQLQGRLIAAAAQQHELSPAALARVCKLVNTLAMTGLLTEEFLWAVVACVARQLDAVDRGALFEVARRVPLFLPLSPMRYPPEDPIVRRALRVVAFALEEAERKGNIVTLKGGAVVKAKSVDALQQWRTRYTPQHGHEAASRYVAMQKDRLQRMELLKKMREESRQRWLQRMQEQAARAKAAAAAAESSSSDSSSDEPKQTV